MLVEKSNSIESIVLDKPLLVFMDPLIFRDANNSHVQINIDTTDLDTIAHQRSKVKASAGGVEKLGSEKTLGRKRQR